MRFATVTNICIYPVKSARGLTLDSARIVSTGFEWDRQWMIINEKGAFLSQRTHPQLTQIVPELGQEALTLTAPGLPALTVPYSSDGERLAVRVHRDCCVGVDQGAEAAEWATRAVRESVRLVRVPQSTERRANAKFAGPEPAPMGFADGYPILVCNQSSLDQLNDRMPKPIPMDRFRPNIVLMACRPGARTTSTPSSWAGDAAPGEALHALLTPPSTSAPGNPPPTRAGAAPVPLRQGTARHYLRRERRHTSRARAPRCGAAAPAVSASSRPRRPRAPTSQICQTRALAVRLRGVEFLLRT